jgi:hypothetical protein
MKQIVMILAGLVAWLVLRRSTTITAALDRWLGLRGAPALLGLVSALALWWTWGSLNPVEVIHDETAYLLQATLLAHGHVLGPARPIAAFFEQFQVFAEPAVTAKYPLGFPLALVPGIWLGIPGLVPVLLIGLSGGLIFALARRVSTPATALVAWTLWFTAPGSIPFRQLIMSETLTTTLWLIGWWGLLEWKETGSRRWLMMVAAATAWCVITRPLTGAAFGVVTGAVVVAIGAREGRLGSLVPAAGVALLILVILPLQNQVVTGSWTESAWSHYTRVYAPSDHFGFGVDSTPPQRSLPPDFGDYIWYYGEFHRNFGPAAVPRLFVERGGQVLHDAWGWTAPVAALVAGLGLAGAGAPLLIAAATALLLLLLHLGFAHPPEWSIYYEEMVPVLAVLTAVGARRVAELLPVRFRASTVWSGGASPAADLVALAIVLFGFGLVHTSEARTNYRLLSQYHREFRQKVAALPGRPIVFVRYARNHIFHRSLITNPPDLAGARAWIVYDMGPQNVRLLATTPGRVPFIYFEHGDSLRAWMPADTLSWP